MGDSHLVAHSIICLLAFTDCVIGTSNQGCGVGVGAGVGVARGRGNEPGVGAGVGVDQTASTPTPERFVGICDIICICRGGFACTFWK